MNCTRWSISNVSCHGIKHLGSSLAECVTHVPGLFCYPSPRTAPNCWLTFEWSRRAVVFCRARLIRIVGRTRPSTSILPISRTALQVGDRHDHDLGWPEPVNRLVWESGHQCASGATI